MKNSSEFDLVSVLRLAFVQNQHKLEYQLKDYLSYTSLKEYDINILYTSDEKLAMKQGENLDVDNLTFSSNYKLKLHHKKQEAKQ